MKAFLIALLVLVIGIVAVGFFLPTEYRVEESVVIQATPAEIHPYLDDLEKWPLWAPWVDADPTIVTTYGAQTKGAGASQSWTTAEDGDGELTLTMSDPVQGIAYDMAFIMDESRLPAYSAMRYAAEGQGTKVTWSMEGDMAGAMPPVVSGYVTLFMPGEISSMFQDGLQKLKSVVESR